MTGTAPDVDVKTPITTPPPDLNIPFVDLSVPSVLNINTTQVTDGVNTAPLSSVFAQILNNTVALAGAVTVVTVDQPAGATFNFKYDTDSKRYGASIAFLS